MRLPPELSEWLNLLARWFHVFAAILWVGSTFYFTWLDGRFQEEEREAQKEGGEPEVWMVHSGGFYVVGKRKTPSLKRLHWFKWEAASTWLSGMVLLTLLYYHGGLMVDADVRDIGVWTAGGFGVGMLLVGWIVYDLLLRSPLARNEKAFAVLAFALIVGAAYLSMQVLSARAAFIHVGATLGTIMFLNVWMGILPSQRRMIAAVKEGRAPDPAEGARAKLRSKHNTYMVVPVVFTMISNHYNLILGHEYNWVILSALVLLGWVAAKLIRRA